MKAQAKDAVALAMDWLAQLRDEDSAEPPPGGGEPAIDSAPTAGDRGHVPPAAPPGGEWEDAPSAADFKDAGPAAPAAADWGDAALAAPAAADWGDAALAAPAAADWEGAALAAPAAADGEDARPAVAPAVEWGYVAPATPSAAEWGYVAPAAPAAADFGDAAPAAPPATGSWRAAAPPVGNSGPAAVPPGTGAPGRAGTKAGIEITERAAIGDELRIPLAWCEMGSCISHHADPAALGEADIRTRAITAGWRVDALGRLACPQCQQGDSWFWTAHPVALWDRDTAVAMTSLMAAAVREITGADGAAGVDADAPSGGAPGAIPGGELDAVPGPRPEMARPPGRGRHRGHPAHPDRAQ
jgi:hypothetical protein